MWNPFRRDAPEQRLTLKEWTAEWEKILLRGLDTKSGQSVSPSTALECSAVHACIKVISETIASLPLFVYKRTKEGGKEPAKKDYRWALLHDKPNAYQTSFEWLEMMAGHCCLRGNHVSFIKKTISGKILALEPLNPTWFKEVDQDSNGKVRYTYHHADTGC
jgi:HK97 family phage portal protein